MENDIWQVLLQCVFSFTACTFLYIIGCLLLRFFPLFNFTSNNYYTNVYAAVTLSMTLFVLTFSVVVCKGATINILILPALFLLLNSSKKNTSFIRFHEAFRWRAVIILLGLSLFFVLGFHSMPESEYKQNDAYYYLQVSNAIATTGQENTYGTSALLGAPYIGTEAYHYFEFWLNALLLKCTAFLLPGIQVLRYVCYPVICTTALFGLLALAQNIIRQQLSKTTVILVAAFIFFVPDLISEFEFLRPVFIYRFESNMFTRPNLRTLLLFLPGVLICLNTHKNYLQFVFWMVAVSVSSVIYFAVLMPAAAIYFLMFFFRRKTKQALYPFLSMLLIGVGYTAFYFFKSAPVGATQNSIGINEFQQYLFQHYKIIIFSFFSSVVHSLWVPFIVLFVLWFARRSMFQTIMCTKPMLVFLCIAIVISMILARGLNFIDNAYQFGFVGYTAGWFITFLTLFLLIIKCVKRTIPVVIISGSFFLLFLLQRFVLPNESHQFIFRQNGAYVYGGKKFTDTYIKQIDSALSGKQVIRGGYWGDELFYDSLYYSRRNPNVYSLPSSYIIANKVFLNEEFCLSDSAAIMRGMNKNLPGEIAYLQAAIRRSVFSSRIKSNKPSVNDSRLAFIKKHQLNYLILTRNADSGILQFLHVTKHFSDSNTGERMYVLANDNE